jgi:hypothetical protein
LCLHTFFILKLKVDTYIANFFLKAVINGVNSSKNINHCFNEDYSSLNLLMLVPLITAFKKKLAIYVSTFNGKITNVCKHNF